MDATVINNSPERYLGMTLLSKVETAAQARCTIQTLDRYAKAGIGPTMTRIGGRVWFAADEVDEWMQNCRRPTLGRPAKAA
jgi:predicted DNA-binding transcriptional regulator AlpA